MTAIESQGVKLYVDEGSSPFTLVGELISFAGPDGSANVIDVTNLSSTAREYLMGVSDSGQMSLELNYDPADGGQDRLQALFDSRAVNSYQLVMTDTPATILTFSAFALSFSIAGGVDDKVALSVTLQITGPVVWS